MEVCVELFTHAGAKPFKVWDGARSGKKRAWGLCFYFLIPLLNVSFKMSQAGASSSQIRRIFIQTRSLLYALKVPVISQEQRVTEMHRTYNGRGRGWETDPERKARVPGGGWNGCRRERQGSCGELPGTAPCFSSRLALRARLLFGHAAVWHFCAALVDAVPRVLSGSGNPQEQVLQTWRPGCRSGPGAETRELSWLFL